MSSNAPELFLSEAEMEYLTGYKQPAAQIRWLRKYGLKHYVNAFGSPRVTREAVEGRKEVAAERPKPRIDWSKFEKDPAFQSRTRPKKT